MSARESFDLYADCEDQQLSAAQRVCGMAVMLGLVLGFIVLAAVHVLTPQP